MRKALLLGLSISLWLTAAARADGGLTAELAQVNTSKYPEITLYVKVLDASKQIVEGLTKDDFTVTEDGVPVEIIDFAAGNRAAIATVLTMDRSSSMGVEGKLEGAKAASTTFIDLMRDQDRAALVAFDNAVETLQTFTSDKSALKSRIGALAPGNCTAWYDAVYQSVDLIGSLDGRRSIILLTDGIDCRESLAHRLAGNGSKHDLDQAIEHARQAGIPVYAIGFGKQVTQEVGNEGYDEVKLKRIAGETGGEYYHAPDAAELKRLYESLSLSMQREYVLTYRSPRPTFDGTRRNIVVSVQQGGGARATASQPYLEEHLVNIRSNPGLFAAFLLPLLVLLAGPSLPGWLGRRRGPAAGAAGGPAPTVPRAAQRVSAAGAGPAGPPAAGVDRSAAQAVWPAPAPQPPAVQVYAAVPVPAAPLVSSPPMSAPAGPASLRLTARHSLGPAGGSVGSAADNAVVIAHPSVAAHHACFGLVGQRFVVSDLGQNGTFVSFNGDPAQERQITQNALRDGSLVRLGALRCTFRLDAAGAGTLEVPLALSGVAFTIGRDPGCDVTIGGPQVPARAAVLRQEGGRWVVQKADPAAQVFVSYGGDPTQERPLQDRNALKEGSSIRIGSVTLTLEAAAQS